MILDKIEKKLIGPNIMRKKGNKKEEKKQKSCGNDKSNTNQTFYHIKMFLQYHRNGFCVNDCYFGF